MREKAVVRKIVGVLKQELVQTSKSGISQASLSYGPAQEEGAGGKAGMPASRSAVPWPESSGLNLAAVSSSYICIAVTTVQQNATH